MSGEESQDLGAWDLGGSATWRRTMFAAGERPFFLLQTSIHISPRFADGSSARSLSRDSLSVPLRPITLSLSAERFAQPLFLLTRGGSFVLFVLSVLYL